MKKRFYLAVFFFNFLFPGFSQQQDTAALIKEFKKVADFSRQPYLYYSMQTRLESSPMISCTDTATTDAEFYRNGTDVYYKNGAEELFLEDSLLISVNHEKKTIWISKTDKSSKESSAGLFPGNKVLQDMLKKGFTIQKPLTSDGFSHLQFTNKQMAGLSNVLSSRINISYHHDTFLPLALHIEMRMQQPADEDLVTQIKNMGVAEKKLLQEIDGSLYLVRSQTMSCAFNTISTSKEKAALIPKWQNKISFDAADHRFVGMAELQEYTLSQTF